MPIVATIVPIFILVILGWGIHQRGFLPSEFLGPANRLVYYVAIPAMIFQSIAGSTLSQWLNPVLILLTLGSAGCAYIGAWLICRLFRIQSAQAGTFIQSAGHGNLGYIGLAVAFYYLGDSGLVHASVIAGFLMILQNLLSIIALQMHRPDAQAAGRLGFFAAKVFGNPVILSVLAGMLISILPVKLPLIIQRTLSILSGLALPTALLIIGASLSLERMRARFFMVTSAVAIKLMLLPALGWFLYELSGLAQADYLPGLILLASPTATISYVMAREMQGDGDLAVAAISASTLASAVTYMVWLKLASG